MNVIGLTGYAGIGKSTVANYLVERHGFTRLSFAAPLKKMLRTLNPIIAFEDSGDPQVDHVRVGDLFSGGWTEQDIKADPKLGPEYRRLMQVLGTECVRAEQDDFWTLAAERQMTDPTADYVFDDCRFPNEAQFILDRSPEGLWNISRPGFGPVNGHASEAHAGNLGEVIFLLNTDLEALHDQIDNAVEMAFGGVNA